nr:hypothetical protein CFP56_56892 [Quercus suber]
MNKNVPEPVRMPPQELMWRSIDAVLISPPMIVCGSRYKCRPKRQYHNTSKAQSHFLNESLIDSDGPAIWFLPS